MSTDTPPTTEEAAPTPAAGGQMSATALLQMFQKSPGLALVAIILLGGGGGTVGSVFVAPLINDALEKHENDPRAHATEFANLEGLTKRFDTIETRMNEQSEALSGLKGSIETAIKALPPKN
jgi:hypothetical protein